VNTDEQPVAGEFSTPLTRADVGKVENPARLDLHLQKQNIAELATQKQFLQTLVENNFLLPVDIDPFSFLKALLPNFASTDWQLRDELTYPIMARIILLEQDRYQLTGAQLEEQLLTCIDKDHLFYRIGEAGTDSVFMRSFSSLVFPLVLGADRGNISIMTRYARRHNCLSCLQLISMRSCEKIHGGNV